MSLENNLGAAAKVEPELRGSGQGEIQTGADDAKRDERAHNWCGHAKPPADASDRTDAGMTGSSTAAGGGRRTAGGRAMVVSGERWVGRADAGGGVRRRW